MEQLIINNYYHIYNTGLYYSSTECDITYTYIIPDNIDYLDFSLLIDFTTKCLLIKSGILKENKNIDIGNFPLRSIKSSKFIDYIINIYKKCSNRSSYINIDKAIVFWNTYCIMKTIMFSNNGNDNWEFKSLPTYLMNSIYDNTNIFPSIINGTKYTIYKDFSVCTTYDYILNYCSIYNPCITQPRIFSYDIRELLLTIKLYPTELAIILLNKITHIYFGIEHENIWNTTLYIVINDIKSNRYYHKDHPLSIMTDSNTSGDIKLNILKSYFNF